MLFQYYISNYLFRFNGIVQKQEFKNRAYVQFEWLSDRLKACREPLKRVQSLNSFLRVLSENKLVLTYSIPKNL